MKITIPKHIADLLNQSKGWFKYDHHNLWMGTAINLSLGDFKNVDAYWEESDRLQLIVYNWVGDDKEKQSIVTAYLNPLTSPKVMPELWIIKEDKR